MPETTNTDFSKYIIPAGAVLLAFIALNRFFPAKPPTRQVMTSTGQIIDVAQDGTPVDNSTFGGRLGSGIGQNVGEFIGGVPTGVLTGVGSELKQFGSSVKTNVLDPLGDLLGFDQPGIFNGLGFADKNTQQQAIANALKTTPQNLPVTLIRNAQGAVIGVEDPNQLVSRRPTAAEQSMGIQPITVIHQSSGGSTGSAILDKIASGPRGSQGTFISERALSIQLGRDVKPSDVLNLARRGIQVQPSPTRR